MDKKENRERKMREIARQVAKDYLLDDICDYETIITAVAERLWEDFEVKTAVADNLAKSLIDPIWDDVVAEAESEADEAREYYQDRESALRDAREGRW